MTTTARFASEAPNAQDVVVWRALRDLPPGRCAEVGDGPPLLRALTPYGWFVAADVAEPVVVLSVHGTEVPELSSAPWVVLVTDPERTSPPELEGYEHVLFDGVTDVLLHRDHPELRAALGHAACVLDDYSTPAERQLEADVARWRDKALRGWEDHSTDVVHDAELEIQAIRATLSWRVTTPLRAVSARLPSRHRG